MKLRIALYGHPDSGGLWEIHCETQLLAVGFIMPDPEGWPSVFYHYELRLLMVVYVDDFKMSGPKESMKKGWDLVASRIDMDTPGVVSRYLGCDHQLNYNVSLKVEDHPFAHLCRTLPPNRAQRHTGLRITGTSTRRTTSTSGITFSLGRNCSPLNSRSFQHVPCHHSGAQ